MLEGKTQKLNLKILKLKKTAQVVAWTCLDRRTKKCPALVLYIEKPSMNPSLMSLYYVRKNPVVC